MDRLWRYLTRPWLWLNAALCMGSWTFTSNLTYNLHAQVPNQATYFRADFGLSQTLAPLPNNFEDDAQLLWMTELPAGHSTPCVVGDSVFLTTFQADQKELATVALDRETGKIRWKRIVATDYIEPVHSTGSPAASSPASNGQNVFSFFGSYGLLCYDWNGELIWEVPLGKFQDEFGASSSPILVDDMVILNEDHDVDSFIAAFDQRTGQLRWRTLRESATRSYSTPVVLQLNNRRQILVTGALQLAAYDVTTGEKLWWYDGISRIVDSTPIIQDGIIYLASWTPGGDADSRIKMEPFEEALKSYDRNADHQIGKDELPSDSPVMDRFYRIDLDQDGGLSSVEWSKHAIVFERAQNVALAVEPGSERGPLPERYVRWKQTRGLPTVPSSVVHNGIMTMVKDSGVITTLDQQSGRILQQLRAAGQGNYFASLVAGDGKVYLISEQGVMTVLKCGQNSEILSSHDFQQRVMASPVIVDGKFYLRTESAVYCYRKR